MTQFPINLADAVTGHKLQGRTLDKVIVTAWPNMAIMKNWEYTVLSRVKSRKGLYLFDKLDIHKSYAAKPEFKKFITRLRLLEDATMKSVDK
jgi:ATP-dependent exoDNAse (exonuclease V) alpha subunit